MNRIKVYSFVVIMLCFSFVANAGKPKWVGNTPKELNNTYRFIEVISYGNSVESARMVAKQQLAQNEQLRRAVTVSVNSGNLQKIDQKIENGNLVETIHNNITIDTNIAGQQYRLQAYPVDEYVERVGGQFKLYTLYMVGVSNRVVFDRTYKSNSYGATPAVMSIVPGLGQIYKGSTVKGICMLAGVAACGIGVLVCENQRSDYKNKMKEQPQFAKDYNTKANNWETARNVCIGAAAAVWLYNIIDAAVAKGSRRIVVKPASGNYLSIHPVATPDAVGVSLAYNF